MSIDSVTLSCHVINMIDFPRVTTIVSRDQCKPIRLSTGGTILSRDQFKPIRHGKNLVLTSCKTGIGFTGCRVCLVDLVSPEFSDALPKRSRNFLHIPLRIRRLISRWQLRAKFWNKQRTTDSLECILPTVGVSRLAWCKVLVVVSPQCLSQLCVAINKLQRVTRQLRAFHSKAISPGW